VSAGQAITAPFPRHWLLARHRWRFPFLYPNPAESQIAIAQVNLNDFKPNIITYYNPVS
jgi:hypothetical protein